MIFSNEEMITMLKNFKPVDSEVEDSQTLPCKISCIKCGSNDINRIYRKKGDYVSIGMGEKAIDRPPYLAIDIPWGWSVLQEHINHHCRVCQYDWQTEILPSKV